MATQPEERELKKQQLKERIVRDPLPEFSCPVSEPVCVEIGKCR